MHSSLNQAAVCLGPHLEPGVLQLLHENELHLGAQQLIEAAQLAEDADKLGHQRAT